MRRWERIVDRLVMEAIGDGDVSHLPGAGKPLGLEDDPHTPADMRVAHKIMADNDVIPEWIAAGKALESMEQALRNCALQRAANYSKALSSARQQGSRSNVEHIQSQWQQFRQDFAERIRRYNREVLLYNLKLPAGLPRKQVLISDTLLESALEQGQAQASERA